MIGGMKEERTPLLMLEFLYGESAKTAQRDAPDRLLAWAEAFDEWLAELGAKYTKSTTKQARLAWRRLLQEGGVVKGRFPWALGEEDIQAHAAWMGTEDKLYAKCNSSVRGGTIALLV